MTPTHGLRVSTIGPRPMVGTVQIDRHGVATVWLDRAMPTRNHANKVIWRRRLEWDPERFTKLA